MKHITRIVIVLILSIFLVSCTSTTSVTIHFDTNGGLEIPALSTRLNSSFSLPDNPTKDGFVFGGWYFDDETFNDAVSIESLKSLTTTNVTVYAKWNYLVDTSFRVSFVTNINVSVEDQVVAKGNIVSVPHIIREGYTLEGWYTSLDGGQTFHEKWSFAGYTVNDDLTLYANWVINQYTIQFYDQSELVQSTTLDYKAFISVPNDLIKDGYIFGGWYTDISYSTPLEISLMPAHDVTVYAKWIAKTYRISFDSMGGTEVAHITQPYMTTVIPPSHPTKEGYTFAGWYQDESYQNPYTFTVMPKDYITLYAKWEIMTYTIRFYDGQTLLKTSMYTIEQMYALGVSSKEGYTFEGWYDNPTFEGEVIESFDTGTTGNISLYAKFSINTYQLNYTIVQDEFDYLSGIPLQPEESIVQSSLGDSHSAAITSHHRLLVWGHNEYGQLGDGTTKRSLMPIDVTSQLGLHENEILIEVALGDGYTAVLTSEGRMFTWGHNIYGQLGIGSTEDSLEPVDITNQFTLTEGETIVDISIGNLSSAAITSTGQLWMWGYNYYGQIGSFIYTYIDEPTLINSHFDLEENEVFVEVETEGIHSIARTSLQRVFIWGFNYLFDLGTINDITNAFVLEENESVVSFAVGYFHMIALTSEGKIFTWGSNDYGQLGDGSTYYNKKNPTNITHMFDLEDGEVITQISAGNYFSLALTSRGRVFKWGSIYDYHYLSEFKSPKDITEQFILGDEESIIAISSGSNHVSALTSEGRLFTWGLNLNGTLGDGTYTSHLDPRGILFTPLELTTEMIDYNHEIMLLVPTKEGYTFSGWYKDPTMTEAYDLLNMPARDMYLYGYWTINNS